MKINYKNILSFLDDNPSIEDISEKLFQLGHENEIEGKHILDIEITPNRGDCLSVRGISRDLGAFYGFNSDLDLYDQEINPIELNFINKAKVDCPKISFLSVEIDKIPNKYETFLEDYFVQLENKKNNFFTDISNYLAYEMGQPTHCYDPSLIKGPITLEKSSMESPFETLLGQKVIIDKDNLVFKANQEIINLAGVMGGINTACTKSTKSVLIECAYFMPESIIGKSLKYNLNSDAAYKFERNIDMNMQEDVLRRFLKIISLHANILNVGIYTNESYIANEKAFTFDSSKLSKILGLNLNENNYINILQKVGFNIKDNSIEVPSHRNDITNHNDLAEEVARIYGYDNLPSKSHSSYNNNKKINTEKTCHNGIRNFLANNGFKEVINFPFSEHEHNIKIDNPIDSNMPFMRKDLKNSLLNNMLFNERRQKDIIKIYEISEIYDFNSESNIPVSEERIAILISGRKSNSYIDFSKNLDKNYLKEIFSELKIDIDDDAIKEIDRTSISSKLKRKIFYFEAKIEKFQDCFNEYDAKVIDFNNCVKIKKISDFPSSVRDLSLLITNESKINILEDKILSYKSDNLKESYIFDFFKNPNNNEIKMGIRFVFQSVKKTLTEKDVEIEIKKIIKIIDDVGDTTIPGLN
jgi:phenylalanyl-tRNA synthetase beta chain